MGRHSAQDDDDEPPVPAAPVDDFAVLRADSSLRTHCLLAGFLPVAIYTVVLIALGEVRLWATLLVLPLALSGVLIGTFLDAAHRRRSPSSKS